MCFKCRKKDDVDKKKIPSLRLIPSVILLILRLRVKLKDNVFQ